jgi:hypothetical protein
MVPIFGGLTHFVSSAAASAAAAAAAELAVAAHASVAQWCKVILCTQHRVASRLDSLLFQAEVVQACHVPSPFVAYEDAAVLQCWMV